MVSFSVWNLALSFCVLIYQGASSLFKIPYCAKIRSVLKKSMSLYRLSPLGCLAGGRQGRVAEVEMRRRRWRLKKRWLVPCVTFRDILFKQLSTSPMCHLLFENFSSSLVPSSLKETTPHVWANVKTILKKRWHILACPICRLLLGKHLWKTIQFVPCFTYF